MGRSSADEPQRLDLQGDPVPAGAIARLGTVRLRHVARDGSGAACLAFTPDGKALVSGGEVGLRVWDLSTGKDLRWLRERVPATAATFAVDGKTLRTFDNQGTTRWLETGTGEVLRETRQPPGGPLSGVASFIAADGKVAGVLDVSGTVRLWDVESGGLLRTVEAPRGGLLGSATLSPDGHTLVRSGKGNQADVIDVATGKVVRQIEGPNHAPQWREEGFSRRWAEAVHGFTFSPDGALLAATGMDFLVVWEAGTGRRRYQVRGDHGRLAFSPDGKCLACGGDEGIRLYEAATGTEVRRFERHPGPFRALTFAPDGKTLAAAQDYVISLWDVSTGRRRLAFAGHETPATCLAFAPDGASLASGSQDLLVWDLKTGKPRCSCAGHYPGVLSVAYAPDDKRIATGDGYGGGGHGGLDAHIRFWDAADGRLLRDFSGHLNSVQALAFAPDGCSLASVGGDARARLWDVATGKQLYQIRRLDSQYGSVAFSPDGKALAVAGTSGELALRRADSGELLTELGPNGSFQRRVLRVGFLGNSRTVLSCEANHSLVPNVIRVWDAGCADEVRWFKTDVLLETASFALAPDGRTLALAGAFAPDNSIQVLDTASGRLVMRLHGHGGSTVTALAFSPDGKVLASAGRDTTILLWDLARARLEYLWSELTAGPGEAARAIRQAATTPEEAVPILKERLSRVQECEGRVAARLADLDDDRYAVREKATRELEGLGPEAAFALGLALEAAPSVEVRRRIEKVLGDQKRSEENRTDDARGVTLAIAVLEGIGSPEARHVLAELARGPAKSVVAREARAAQERLARKHQSP